VLHRDPSTNKAARDTFMHADSINLKLLLIKSKWRRGILFSWQYLGLFHYLYVSHTEPKLMTFNIYWTLQYMYLRVLIIPRGPEDRLT